MVGRLLDACLFHRYDHFRFNGSISWSSADHKLKILRRSTESSGFGAGGLSFDGPAGIRWRDAGSAKVETTERTCFLSATAIGTLLEPLIGSLGHILKDRSRFAFDQSDSDSPGDGILGDAAARKAPANGNVDGRAGAPAGSRRPQGLKEVLALSMHPGNAQGSFLELRQTTKLKFDLNGWIREVLEAAARTGWLHNREAR